MLLLIMCGDLEVADRRMTPAITLVFAQAFVAGQQFPPMAPIFYVTMMSEQSADDLTSI